MWTRKISKNYRTVGSVVAGVVGGFVSAVRIRKFSLHFLKIITITTQNTTYNIILTLTTLRILSTYIALQY